MAAKVAQPKSGRQNRPAVIAPEIVKLQKFIDSNSEIYMGFHQMFAEKTSPFAQSIPNYEVFLSMLNQIIQEAPFFGDIGPPIFMLLTRAMNTHGGFTTFLDMKLNTLFKHIFAKWAALLASPASCYVLTEENRGWFSAEALDALTENSGGIPVEEVFLCDPAAAHYGFTSYDDFFNRRLRPGIRPIVKKIVTVPGTYFCQSPANIGESDDLAYLESLAFLTAVATRQLFFIEAENPKIGLYCFIAIGMAEISGTEATVKEGQVLKKGDEIGMFHFGGSSHALVFDGKTKLRFFNGVTQEGRNIGVREAIATVKV
ncbi:Phophatidylserine decarboxylase-domain-containing protein [Mycena crocata]|nr:Phophatidylserine decarboxylase-domain-containing protein [Mycena crocata]